jgi:uncharacterized protein
MKNMQMNTRAQIRMLADGRRVHMHDGPIDLIVEAFGEASEVRGGYQAAAERFVNVLDELCRELSLLRQPAREDSPLPEGAVARRMMLAVCPHAARNFITPMAAVAGAVAEEILQTMTASATLTRAYVNDGGDIALHLAPGEKFVVGMAEYAGPSDPTFRKTRNVGHPQSLFGSATITFEDPIRGIATSGWRGRSFSLGIANAVTVVADTAAMADAAATIIANAVDLPGSPKIVRRAARDLAPDSDLGERLVTQSVASLSLDEINVALEGGVREADLLRAAGLIQAAALHLQGETRVAGMIVGGSTAAGATVAGATAADAIKPVRYNSAAAGSLVHA